MANNDSAQKRAKNAARLAEAEAQRASAREAALAAGAKKQGRLRLILLCALIAAGTVLLLVFFAYPSNLLPVLCCIGAVVIMLLGYSRKRAWRLASPMTAALLVYLILCGVTCAYALSGKFFMSEYQKLLICFFVYLLIVTLPMPRAKAARAAAAVLAGMAAVMAVMSVEAASTGVFQGLLKHFPNWGGLSVDFEAGTRMTGIFGNANVSAGVFGFGIYLSLYLLESFEKPWQRYTSAVMLSLNAFAFLLSFSMGGTAMFLLGAVLYLIFAGPGRRINSLLRMVETIIPTVIFAFVAFYAFRSGGGALPLAAMALNAVVLCLLDRFVYERLSALLRGRRRAIAVIFCAVAVVIAAYAGLGVSVAGGYTSDGSAISRSVYPAAGENRLSVSAGGDVRVKITSQNSAQTMTHDSSLLYEGPAAGAVFTVPEDSLVVYVVLEAEPGVSVDSAALATGETIKLDYKLLPGFIANRLQGLRANQNAIQRTVFFRDGMALFAKKPVFGSGLGSFESAVPSVQSFYYETKYVHNNYIQVLLETGVVGFVFYLLALALPVVALIRRRKSPRRRQLEGIYPALWAGMAFLCGHSAVEVTMSASPSLLYCFSILALTALCFGGPAKKEAGDGSAADEPVALSSGEKALSWGVRGGSAALAAVFAVLFIMNMTASGSFEKNTYSSPAAFLAAAAKAEKRDPFEYNDYRLTYVMGAMDAGYEGAWASADIYADELAQGNSNSTAPYLLRYYLTRGSYEKAADYLVSALAYNRANSEAWNRCFGVVMDFYAGNNALLSGPGEPALIKGLDSAFDMLYEFNASALSPVELDAESMKLAEILGRQES